MNAVRLLEVAEMTLTVFRLVIIPVCLLLCVLISNFLLECFHLYMDSVPQHQQRLLNIFYSDMARLWQLDTIFCASFVLVNIVLQVESDLLDQATSQLMYLELKQAACYLVIIGGARLAAHQARDVYLEASTRWNGHWLLLVTLLLSALIQLTTFQLCDSEESFTHYSDLTLYTMAGTAFILHLVLELDILRKRYKARRTVGPAPVQSAGHSGTGDVSFSVGSLSLLLLTTDLCIVSVFFYYHSIRVTSASAALVQLVNMTLLALYWTVAQHSLRQHCHHILKKIFQK